MKIIDKPLLDSIKVFDQCVAGIVDVDLQEKFLNARTVLQHRYAEYEIKAEYFQLFSIKSCLWGKDGQVIAEGVTKKEFTDLYTTNFAAEGAIGRTHYDAIKMLAPLGKCPYCGFGQVSTLDHYMAKSRYPALSILPANLIPSCFDCNKGKGSSLVEAQSLTLHPYFESNEIHNDVWLYAKINQTVPLSIDYEINPPTGWGDGLKDRLSNYFIDFELARRFAIEAATELASLIHTMDDLTDFQDRISHLSRIARTEHRVHPNSWKAALYSVLKDDLWYVQHGYKQAATK